MKRILGTLLALTMLAGAVFPAFAAGEITPYTITKDALLERVEKVVVPQDIIYTSFYNIDSIARADLQAAAETARGNGGKVFFYFETLVDDHVVGRVVVNPFLVKSDVGELSLIVDTTASNANKKVQQKFEKTFGRKVAVMNCSQQGDFGITVVLAGKLNLTGMDTDNLAAYTYNAANNEFTKIYNAKCTVDESGFVYLQTTKADYILITEDK